MEEIDALFNEGLNEAIPDLSNQFHPQLGSRLAELSTHGCCQRIIWTRSGALVYTTKDGTSIGTCVLKQDFQQGTWRTQHQEDPKLSEQLKTWLKSGKIVHLSCNPFGHEILCCDAFGRRAILSPVQAMNRFNLSREFASHDDESQTVVAVHWLVPRSQFNSIICANKTVTGWRASTVVSRMTPTPWIKSSRAAVVTLSRGGMLRCTIQQLNGKWTEHEQPIASLMDDYDCTISHADFTHAVTVQPPTNPRASNPDTSDHALLLGCYTARGMIRLYRVSMEWSEVVDANGVQTKANLKVQMLQELHADQHATMNGDSALKSSILLTHFRLLPPIQNDVEHIQASPKILTLYQTSRTQSQFQMGLESASEATLVMLWSVESRQVAVDSTFAKMAAKNSTAEKSRFEVHLEGPKIVYLEKPVLGIDVVSYLDAVSIRYANGMSEIRDYDMLFKQPKEDQIARNMMIGQHYFPTTEQCLDSAISPNYCMQALDTGAEQPHLVMLQSLTLLNPEDEEQVSEMIANFVLQHANAELSAQVSNSVSWGVEDLLMTMSSWTQHFTPDMVLACNTRLVTDLYVFLGVKSILSDSGDNGMKRPQLQKLLSLQSTLGRSVGLGNTRTFSSQLAYLATQLRHQAMCSALAMSEAKNMNPNGGNFFNPVIFEFISELLDWSSCLSDWMISEFLEMNRRLETARQSGVAIEINSLCGNSVALVLLLCTSTRSYLKTAMKCMATLQLFSASLLKAVNSNVEPYIKRKAAHVLSNQIMRPRSWEHILIEIDTLIKVPVETASTPEHQDRELQMMVTGVIDDYYTPHVKILVEQGFSKLRSVTNESALALKDFRRLGFLEYLQGPDNVLATGRLDAYRKILLEKNRPLKKCIRCDESMEDVIFDSPNQRTWVHSLMGKGCYCGGSWYVDQPRAVVV